MRLHDDCGGSKDSNINSFARILGPGTAALFEFSVFYGMDTCAKRLMSHQGSVVNYRDMPTTLSTVRNIIFPDCPQGSFVQKFRSLYPGVGYGQAYKISQRVYKFGGQPIISGLMKDSPYSRFVRRMVGKEHERVVQETTAGAMVSAGEILLAPLDILKIKAQTNPEAIKNFHLLEVLRKRTGSLFVGAPWLISRNFVGGSALFGGSAATKQYVLKLDEKAKPTFSQLIMASAGGSFTSIIVSSPFDVVKTRVQRAPFDQRVSGTQVVKDIIQNEGIGAFTKGIVPKTLTVGPKIMLTYTLAQYLTHKFSDLFNSSADQKKAL